jgi:hypothetical protein
MTHHDDVSPDNEAAAGWLAIAGAVADGRLAPEEGIARLRALQAQHPDDAEWLEEEVTTIRWTFGMDIEDIVAGDTHSYWDKVLSVTEGLLEERVTPSQAVDLLERVRAQFPEQQAHVQKLIEDIAQSPLWQLMDSNIE